MEIITIIAKPWDFAIGTLRWSLVTRMVTGNKDDVIVTIFHQTNGTATINSIGKKWSV